MVYKLRHIEDVTCSQSRQPSTVLLLYAGMAAAKHRASAAQPAALGMVGPLAGMLHLQQLLASAASGVLGGASSTYWRLLLRSVKQPPAIFQDVLAEAVEEDKVCLRCTAQHCWPDCSLLYITCAEACCASGPSAACSCSAGTSRCSHGRPTAARICGLSSLVSRAAHQPGHQDRQGPCWRACGQLSSPG